MWRQGKGSIIITASFVAVMGAAASQVSFLVDGGIAGAYVTPNQVTGVKRKNLGL